MARRLPSLCRLPARGRAADLFASSAARIAAAGNRTGDDGFIGARETGAGSTEQRDFSSARDDHYTRFGNLHGDVGASADDIASEGARPYGGREPWCSGWPVPGHGPHDRDGDREISSCDLDQDRRNIAGNGGLGGPVGWRADHHPCARPLPRGDRPRKHREGNAAARGLRPGTLPRRHGPHRHAEPDRSGGSSDDRRAATQNGRARRSAGGVFHRRRVQRPSRGWSVIHFTISADGNCGKSHERAGSPARRCRKIRY